MTKDSREAKVMRGSKQPEDPLSGEAIRWPHPEREMPADHSWTGIGG
ncbi:MAG: hypothetical protein JJU29_07535 [Verrucomicrobia bacterium]|nr:hypothetical protein [Verrucomicrobiota bacterium]MCH8511646.1 hypothetical protein [Kiritimatiellia bacterium]